jgi:hypothetical protein
VIFNITSISLINYDLESLLEILHHFFEEETVNKSLTKKCLRIIGASLKDSALFNKVEAIV